MLRVNSDVAGLFAQLANTSAPGAYDGLSFYASLHLAGCNCIRVQAMLIMTSTRPSDQAIRSATILHHIAEPIKHQQAMRHVSWTREHCRQQQHLQIIMKLPACMCALDLVIWHTFHGWPSCTADVAHNHEHGLCMVSVASPTGKVTIGSAKEGFSRLLVLLEGSL